jgi:TrmH family RNA methyltransferase
MTPEKVITSLIHKKYRDQHGLFLIEGPDVIEHCLDHGYPLKELIIDENLKQKHNFITVMARKKRVEVNFAQRGQIEKLSETVTTQGAIALAEIRRGPGDDPGLSVYLDCVQDPGNVGAVIRCAAAAGFKSVIAGRGTADFFGPKVVRGSAGGFANVECVDDSACVILEKLKARGYRVVITDCQRGKDYRQLERSGKYVIVMGNEGEGVSARIAELADTRIHIPMSGVMRSLNIAVAFGVIAFSIFNPPAAGR